MKLIFSNNRLLVSPSLSSLPTSPPSIHPLLEVVVVAITLHVDLMTAVEVAATKVFLTLQEASLVTQSPPAKCVANKVTLLSPVIIGLISLTNNNSCLLALLWCLTIALPQLPLILLGTPTLPPPTMSLLIFLN